jgi:hypothetical protein
VRPTACGGVAVVCVMPSRSWFPAPPSDTDVSSAQPARGESTWSQKKRAGGLNASAGPRLPPSLPPSLPPLLCPGPTAAPLVLTVLVV